MVHEDVWQRKKLLRREALACRRSLSAQANRAFSEAIEERLKELDACRKAKTFFAFAAMSDEVQLYSLIEKALAEGKRVALPLIVGKGVMEAVRVRALSDLVPGAFDIPTVREERREIVDPKSLDCVLVPGAAFSRDGARLGLGAGFYDRFLGEKAPQAQRIAVAFSCQIMDEVPREAHDVMMHAIVTENETILCR